MRLPASLMICGLAVAPILGCGGTSSGAPERGGLRIVLAVPRQGPDALEGKDTALAARLELESHGSAVAGRTVSLVSVNESDPASGEIVPERLADAVSNQTSDPKVVAWVGGLDSDALAVELPRLNEAGVATVSPGATATPFTRVDPAFPGAPTKYFPAVDTFGRAFMRTTPTDLEIAAATLADLRRRGVSRVMTVDSGDTDGDSFASAIEQLAPREGVKLVGHESVVQDEADWSGLVAEASAAHAQSIIWGSSPGDGQTALWAAVRDADLQITMVSGPSVPADWLQNLAFTTQPTLGYTPDVPAALQGSNSRRFAAEFRRKFGHQPAAGSLRGAAALALALRAVALGLATTPRAADSTTMRAQIAKAADRIRTSDSLMGRVDLNRVGDWAAAPVGVWQSGRSRTVFQRLVR